MERLSISKNILLGLIILTLILCPMPVLFANSGGGSGGGGGGAGGSGAGGAGGTGGTGGTSGAGGFGPGGSFSYYGNCCGSIGNFGVSNAGLGFAFTGAGSVFERIGAGIVNAAVQYLSTDVGGTVVGAGPGFMTPGGVFMGLNGQYIGPGSMFKESGIINMFTGAGSPAGFGSGIMDLLYGPGNQWSGLMPTGSGGYMAGTTGVGGYMYGFPGAGGYMNSIPGTSGYMSSFYMPYGY